MISGLTLDDSTGSPVTLHKTANRSIETGSGLVGLSAPRRNTRVRPQAHGSIDDTRYLDEDAISLVGHVYAPTQALAFAELGLITAPMLQTLNVAALLKWFPGELVPQTNLVPNPRPVSTGTPWLTGQIFTNTATLSYAADGASPSGQSLQAAGSGAATFQGMELPIGVLQKNQRYGILVALKSISGATAGSFGIADSIAGGALINAIVAGITMTGAYVVTSTSFTPTNTAPCSMFIRHDPATAATFRFGGAMLVPLGPTQALPTYFDATTAGYGSTGVADVSPSVILGGRQRLVKLAGSVQPVIAGSACTIEYQASLAAADPLAYEQALTTVVGTGNPVSPGVNTATFNNAGGAPTRPVLRVTAGASPIVNPFVFNAVTGIGIKMVGTIAAGDFVDLDLNLRTATLNHSGTLSNAASLVDSANTQWLALPPGSTILDLQVTSGTTGTLTIIGRSAYTV